MFGAEDFQLDVGSLCFADASASRLEYARSSVVIAAASSGLIAIDRVVVDYSSDQLLVEDSRLGRRLGFAGKAVIHPAQIGVVNEQFSPHPEDVAAAQQLIDAYEVGLGSGSGAVSVDGKMVDLPVVEKARRIVEFAKAAGKIDGSPAVGDEGS